MSLEDLIEARLTAVEKELAQIREQLASDKRKSEAHPWEKVFGAFANSEGFEEAVLLGREYRQNSPKCTPNKTDRPKGRFCDLQGR